MADQPLRENPFAAPEAIFEPTLDEQAEVVERTGPPWEQSGPWPRRFFETMWLAYVNPLRLFRGMRRRGSWWMPVAYYLVATLLANALLFLLVQSPGAIERIGIEAPDTWGMESLGLAFVAGVIVLLHIALRILGSRQPIVTTFRATFYIMGSSIALMFVPVLGQFLSLPYLLVALAISIYAMHDLSIWRAGCGIFAALFVAMAIVVAIFVIGVLLGLIPEPA